MSAPVIDEPTGVRRLRISLSTASTVEDKSVPVIDEQTRVPTCPKVTRRLCSPAQNKRASK